MAISRAGRVVAVGGGAGVGKSAVAANLAAALIQEGARALKVGAAEPGLLHQVRALDAEVVLVDLGADPAAADLALFDAADLRLVVATPRQEAVEAAYAFMGGAVLRRLRRVAAQRGGLARLDEEVARSGAAFSAARLLAGLAREAPDLAAALQAALSGLSFRLVGNQLAAVRDTSPIFALSRMVRDFLGVEAPVLGSLPVSERLRAAQGAGCPYLLQEGAAGEPCAACFQTMARALRATTLPEATPAAPGEEDLPVPLPAPGPASLAALPVSLGEYQRAYQRHLVSLPATLVYPGGLLPVMLEDVSEGGALLSLERPPPVGTRITLIVPGLGDHPGLACVVRHAEPGRCRAGVQFLAEREEGRRLAEALRLAEVDRRLDAGSAVGRCV